MHKQKQYLPTRKQAAMRKSRFRSRAAKVLFGALAVLTLSALPAVDDVADVVSMDAEPAAAWGSPIAYRQAGNHWSPMYGMPDTDQYTVVTQWLAPGEPFWPDCYMDVKNAYHYRNYSTARWFRGWSKNHGWGYIHASFIYYQERKPVGRC